MFDASALVTCDADLEAAVGARPGATLLAPGPGTRVLLDHGGG